MTTEWLSMKDVTFSFGETPLFNNLNLNLYHGEVCHLSALDCRGVSTLTRVMAALTECQQGQVHLFGQNLNEISKEEFLPYRLKMSYVFDTGGLMSNKSLLENVMLPLLYHQQMPFQESKELAESLLTYFGINDDMNNRPAMVNASSRKLALVARALATDPEVLILDDPDNGLNKQNVEKLINLLVEYMAHHRLNSLVVSSRLTSLWDRILTHKLVLRTDSIEKSDLAGSLRGAA